MRERKKHKKIVVKSDGFTKKAQNYNRINVQYISANEGSYYHFMCKTCKYNKRKCEKGLIPSECAKKGEKYK